MQTTLFAQSRTADEKAEALERVSGWFWLVYREDVVGYPTGPVLYNDVEQSDNDGNLVFVLTDESGTDLYINPAIVGGFTVA